MKIVPYRLILATYISICFLLADEASAAWKQIARTDRHTVSYDAGSVTEPMPGRKSIMLRFVPLGERQRGESARDYEVKEYRWHYEQYEIMCGEASSVLGYVDIYGQGGTRLARTKGDGTADVIIPGTVLDRVYQVVCPAAEDDEKEDQTDTPDASPSSEITPERAEQERKINEALLRTVSQPSSHAAWAALGNACFDAGLAEKAVAAYDRALALQPDDVDVLNDQGAMIHQTGDPLRALRNFEKALKMSPDNLDSLYNAGFIYAYDLNRLDKALEFWKHYLDLDKTSETARQIQEFISKNGRNN